MVLFGLVLVRGKKVGCCTHICGADGEEREISCTFRVHATLLCTIL